MAKISTNTNEQLAQLVIVGSGGHAVVCADVAMRMGYSLYGFYDDNPNAQWKGVGIPKSLGRVDSIQQLSVDSEVLTMEWFVGIGDAKLRKKIVNDIELWFDKLKAGLRPRWATLIHPFTSFPAENRYTVGEGSLVCAGAVVQPNVAVGKHVVLNTSCSVDHDSIIEDYANVMPKACLCGITFVGEGTIVGAGAVVIQTKKIGRWSIVGAGATVLGDVPDGVTVVGLIRKNHQ